MWHLTPPKDLIITNGWVVVYGKNAEIIKSIRTHELSDMHSCLQDRIIELNLNTQELWRRKLNNTFVIACWGIPPYVIEEHGGIIQALF